MLTALLDIQVADQVMMTIHIVVKWLLIRYARLCGYFSTDDLNVFSSCTSMHTAYMHTCRYSYMYVHVHICTMYIHAMLIHAHIIISNQNCNLFFR